MMKKVLIFLSFIIMIGFIYNVARISLNSRQNEIKRLQNIRTQELEQKIKYYEDLLNVTNTIPNLNWYMTYSKEMELLIQRIEGNNFCDNRFGFKSLHGFENNEVDICSSDLVPKSEKYGHQAAVACRKNNDWNKPDGYCFTNLPVSINSKRNIGIHCTKSQSYLNVIHSFPNYMYNTGVQSSIRFLEPFVKEKHHNFKDYHALKTLEEKSKYLQLDCDTYSDDVAVFVKRDGEGNLFHTFAEFVSTYDTLLSHGYQEGSAQVIFVDDRGIGYNHEVWKAITGRDAIQYTQIKKNTCYKSAIFALPAGGGPLWESVHNPIKCHSGSLWRGFVNRISAYYNLPTHIESNEQTILLVDRKQKRKFVNIAEIVQTIQDAIEQHKEYSKFVLKRVMFEDLAYEDQIRTVRSSSIMIGLHGAGLAHSMFLPENAFLIEVSPKGWNFDGFRNLARLTGKRYLSIYTNEVVRNNEDGDRRDYNVDKALFKKAIESSIVSMSSFGNQYSILSKS